MIYLNQIGRLQSNIKRDKKAAIIAVYLLVSTVSTLFDCHINLTIPCIMIVFTILRYLFSKDRIFLIFDCKLPVQNFTYAHEIRLVCEVYCVCKCRSKIVVCFADTMSVYRQKCRKAHCGVYILGA